MDNRQGSFINKVPFLFSVRCYLLSLRVLQFYIHLSQCCHILLYIDTSILPRCFEKFMSLIDILHSSMGICRMNDKVKVRFFGKSLSHNVLINPCHKCFPHVSVDNDWHLTNVSNLHKLPRVKELKRRPDTPRSDNNNV